MMNNKIRSAQKLIDACPAAPQVDYYGNPITPTPTATPLPTLPPAICQITLLPYFGTATPSSTLEPTPVVNAKRYLHLTDAEAYADTPSTPPTDTSRPIPVDFRYTLDVYALSATYPNVYQIKVLWRENDITTIETLWFNARSGVDIPAACANAPTITPTPVATSTPTITPTPAITATLTPQGIIADLAQNYGVFLEDLTTTNYWLDPTYSNNVNYAARVEAIYAVVVHYDQVSFASVGLGAARGQNFKAVFGIRTVFRYTGIAQRYAAEVKLTQRTENVIELYKLTGVYDKVDVRCGSKDDNGDGISALDITRCTIAHELGHVLVARAARGVSFGDNYDDGTGKSPFGLVKTEACGWRWDPGENGWPWREHRISGDGTYQQNLCNTEPSIVIREFEADMIMNFVLDFFNPNNANEKKRSEWVKEQIYGDSEPSELSIVGWIKQAKAFTGN
jgi:hypothetical protein